MDYNKRSNTHVTRVQEREKEGRSRKSIKNMIAENILNLAKDINLPIYEPLTKNPKEIHTETHHSQTSEKS